MKSHIKPKNVFKANTILPKSHWFNRTMKVQLSIEYVLPSIIRKCYELHAVMITESLLHRVLEYNYNLSFRKKCYRYNFFMSRVEYQRVWLLFVIIQLMYRVESSHHAIMYQDQLIFTGISLPICIWNRDPKGYSFKK